MTINCLVDYYRFVTKNKNETINILLIEHKFTLTESNRGPKPNHISTLQIKVGGFSKK